MGNEKFKGSYKVIKDKKYYLIIYKILKKLRLINIKLSFFTIRLIEKYVIILLTNNNIYNIILCYFI